MYDIGAKRTKQPDHGHERGEITKRCDSSRNVDRGKTDARDAFEDVRAVGRARDKHHLVPGSDRRIDLAAQMMQKEKRDSGKPDDTHSRQTWRSRTIGARYSDSRSRHS